MSMVDESSVYKELGSVKIQTFSSEVEAIQFCRDDDSLYEQLVRSSEREPFLLARLVKVANSVLYAGQADSYVCTASECMMRIGLTTAQQVALDFLVNKSIGRITQANEFARATWGQAMVAGRLSRELSEFCEAPFDISGPFLPTLLSYLGEVFVMGLVVEEADVPDMGVYTRAGGEAFDVFGLSVTIMERLGMPKPVEEAVKQSHLLLASFAPPYISSAAVVILCRYLAQAHMPAGIRVARVDDELRDSALEVLSLTLDDLAGMEKRAKEAQVA